MRRRLPASSAALAVGVLALIAFGAPWALDAAGARSFLRETALDLSLRAARPAAAPIVVVDIDSETLRRYGAWPWSRSLLARLVEALAAHQPRVIGLDMLFAGPDRHAPASVARRLAAETGRADLAAIAGELADGDADLARALARAPATLGAVFARRHDTPAFEPAFEPTPILVRGAPRLPGIWAGEAALGPRADLAAAAAGVGLIVFENDGDGVVRRVPLLALAGADPIPGFAAETARVARGASTLIVEGPPAQLRIGDLVVPLGTDASLRFRAAPPQAWERRTISAADGLDGKFDPARIRDAIIVVGSSAPEVGILRRTATAEAAPAAQIEADAIVALVAGKTLRRPPLSNAIEAGGALSLALAAILAGAFLRPMRGLLVIGAAMTLWAVLATLALLWRDLLIDPLGPPALAALLFTLPALTAAVVTERRERRLRGRFEQHLAPAVVARILESPSGLRLEGETREVTALFTDIEGFTSMTERAEPRDLIALLDAYFQLLADIVVAHGGMVDKIIGDAIHALFNAPLDLKDHPRRAVECALALHEACEAFRRQPQAKALALGRTRIGLETGPVIIGDVGGKRKLDYTAHGMAVNTAARLEAANKDLGTTICVGPVAAARLPSGMVRPVGRIRVRGRSDELDVFTPAGQ